MICIHCGVEIKYTPSLVRTRPPTFCHGCGSEIKILVDEDLAGEIKKLECKYGVQIWTRYQE